MAIRQQLRGVHINRQVDLNYHYFELISRDKDNVSAYARKVVQDSLVLAGVLDNDGWKNVHNSSDEFDVDKDMPRIEVTIVEVGD